MLPSPLALCRIDFEKAFDTVDWEYLDLVLQKASLGCPFRRMAQLLYQNLTSQVLVTGTLSEIYPVQRGTRHSRPLSPFLFALAIETFTQMIHRDAFLEGWRWAGSRFMPITFCYNYNGLG
ncbi:hypothetical protein NDU88_004183 [Pleurodeles waltl]|uniref:Reverse transcriptase domain-containing protein n=1 Tax=Pleurodeles waltl TaxID=8319 RepID=A0AAV7UES5_PLEWA|nr:hypothetical protein NDU88_004183 [Pleurodeles waltl]